ncbi:MAG: hypothetical protein RLZZ500_2265 [Bacteroidota bacterium]|jgi:hypothetical protein
MIKTLNRTKYLGYYLKQLDWTTFKCFFNYVQLEKKKSFASLWFDIIFSVYKYNIGLMDYFTFRFYSKSHEERNKWVGTGLKYEFDLKMNPIHTRSILENKLEFYQTYAPFIRHAYCSISDLERENEKATLVISNSTGKIVIKDATGQCGWDVEVVEAKDFTIAALRNYMASKKFDLAEEYVQQHPVIQSLSSSGLNTVRMMTMINNDGGVDILGARMRISVNSHVDNLASGNIACPVDLETGIINGKGVYSDITKESVTHHPVTGVSLIGFQIPKWKDIIATTEKIALYRPENRGVGWDVAITEKGSDFIEGNHNWCKILWQIPVDQGLKYVLEKYN